MPDPGQRFLKLIAERDFDSFREALTPQAHLRALLPSQVVEETGPDAIGARFRHWFGSAEPFTVLDAQHESIGDRVALGYRFRLKRPGDDDVTVIEQRLFGGLEGDLLGRIDLVCSGFRPLEGAAQAISEFDAGDLGCMDGLPAEFKTRIKEVGVGALLRVHTSDPSAKEDLPSLARLMGHVVHEVEAQPDGSLVITIERAR